MTDPPPVFDFNVTPSDTAERGLRSPAISISPASNGPQNSTNQAVRFTDDQGRANTAYATNSTSGAEPGFLQYFSGQPETNVFSTHHDQYLANSSTDKGNATSGGPPLASFGSQPWVAPLGPYLDFAPQPIYEPTGELLHEQVEVFQEFDSPSSMRSSASQSQTGTTAVPLTSPNRPTPAHLSSAGNIFAQPSLPKSALKRRAEHDIGVSADPSSNKRRQSSDTGGSKPRSVSFERMSGPNPRSPGDGSTSSDHLVGQRGSHSSTAAASRRSRPSASSTPRAHVGLPSAASQSQSRSSRGSRVPSANPPSVLPPEKVFPIQIGSELFRLSGASISSDAPSYFTQFFEEQLRQNEESGGVRTLYIDRDPVTFRDIARHLQGYYIKPTDGGHFVKLFADAQFYSLPRLIDQLFESEIFIQIGERNFQIPKDIFSDPGNSPNFFSLGFAVFFSTPSEVFPGLDRRGLLRPPSILPPNVPGRSSEVFAELLHMLRGYPMLIRNEEHRADLLRDCRYFHLRGLEQRVIAHNISYNLERQKNEICLKLEDVKPSGVSYVADDPSSDGSPSGGWVNYARPFVDDTSYELIIEIGGETTVLDMNDMRADFHGLAKARVSSLFQVIANKMNLPTNAPLGLMMLSGGQTAQSASPGHTPLSEDRVKVRIDTTTDITLDGKIFEPDWRSVQGRTMLRGPRPEKGEPESESDVVSESTSSREPSRTSSTRHQRAESYTQTAQTTRSRLTVLPLQTTKLPTTKKRKRQGDTNDDFGEWIIRSGQWRLRVQNNPQDAIRGGLEIAFLAVKIDAFTGERARNSRRGFLS